MATSGDELGLQRKVTFGSASLSTYVDAWGNSVGFRRWDTSGEVQGAPYTDNNNSYKDPLDPRNLVAGWQTNGTPSPKRSDVTSLGFNSQNRVTTVYSPCRLPSPSDTADDILGYRLRQFGNSGRPPGQ